jgi:DNA-binding transcriptional MerR regulator
MNETRPSDLMLIREFSTRSRLSGKALRLYDALGLLEPAFVDPHSGYRYYSPGQLERAHRIAFLRQLEMPLQRIAELLQLDGAGAARSLEAYWREVEVLHRDKRSLVQYLGQTWEKKEIPMFKIETRFVPEQKIVTMERRVFVDKLPAFIGGSFNTIYGALGMANLQPSGAPFVIYHGKVDNDSDGPVEVCVPFMGAFEPAGEMRVRLEPAHEEAFTVMKRGSVDGPELMHGYDAVAAWMSERGKKCTLSSREVYFNPAPWDKIPADELAFDVAYPY